MDNETLVYEHLQENLGLEAALIKLQSMKRVKIPLEILIKGETLHDYEKLVQKLDEHAAFFVINVEGISYLEQIRELTSKPLMLELTHKTIKYYTDNIAINGFIIREGIESDDGVELGQVEMHQLKESIQQLLPYKKPIIASGGVYEPSDTMEIFREGASLVQLHGGFVYSDPGLPKRINERILYEKHPISRPAEQTG